MAYVGQGTRWTPRQRIHPCKRLIFGLFRANSAWLNRAARCTGPRPWRSCANPNVSSLHCERSGSHRAGCAKTSRLSHAEGFDRTQRVCRFESANFPSDIFPKHSFQERDAVRASRQFRAKIPPLSHPSIIAFQHCSTPFNRAHSYRPNHSAKSPPGCQSWAAKKSILGYDTNPSAKA